jgi:hypothetical protein
MRGTKSATLAALVLTAGLAGCSLPEVLPLTGATTPGPSPYGVWYEQHWATNSVLLAATDEPNVDVIPTDEEFEALGTYPETNAGTPRTAGTPADEDLGDGEVNAAIQDGTGSDFDTTSPYQFPSSSYAPGGPTQGASASEVLIPPPPSGPEINPIPAPGGQIRY